MPRFLAPTFLFLAATVAAADDGHWAFAPLREVRVPAVVDAAWPHMPIDRFVLARLEEAELAPAADASRAALLRRVNFDLTGLPPTPEELAWKRNANTPRRRSS